MHLCLHICLPNHLFFNSSSPNLLIYPSNLPTQPSTYPLIIYTSIHPSIKPSIFQFICPNLLNLLNPSTYPPIYLSIHLCTTSTIHTFSHLFINLSFYPPKFLSIHKPMCLSIHPVHLFYPYIHPLVDYLFTHSLSTISLPIYLLTPVISI